MPGGLIPLRPTLWVMSGKRPGTDAEGMTLATASQHSKPEIAMQFFSSSQFPWVNSKPAEVVPLPARGAAGMPPVGLMQRIDCGWYDSSFDLAQGLEVSEQEHDTLYQLWELSQH